jgi:apolipoprotein N-acyltransferase
MLSSLLHGFGQTYYTYSSPTTTSNGSTSSPVVWIIALIVVAIVITGMWKVFTKAGRPGWAAIVPFYNTYTLLKIVNRPGWWLILFLIPLVNIVVVVIVYNQLAKAFGKGVGFTVLMVIFPYIAYPILGFGDAKFTNPAGTSAGHTPSIPAATPPVSE